MPDPTQYHVRDFLRSIRYEAMKLFRIYDGSNRVQYQYEAPSNTLDGGLCMRTEYAYDANTTRVLQMKETLDTWQAAWDLP